MTLGDGSGEEGGENRSQLEGRREGEREAGAEQSGTIGHVKRVGRLEKDFSCPATCAQDTHGDTAMPHMCKQR